MLISFIDRLSPKGNVYVLAKGSAYGHSQLWNAVDEGATQVHDTLEYVTPDKLVITQQATTEPGLPNTQGNSSNASDWTWSRRMPLIRQASQSYLTMHLVGMQRLPGAKDLYRRTKHKESAVLPPTRLHTSKAMLHKMPAIMPSCLIVHLAGTERLPVAKDCIEGLRTKTALLHCLSASKPMLQMLMNLQQKELSPAVQRANCCRGIHICKWLSRQRV